MGTCPGGVAQTPQRCRCWLGVLPVPMGWRCRGCPCQLILPLCKLGGHGGGYTGHAAREHGVQRGGVCRCPRERVSEPSRAPHPGLDRAHRHEGCIYPRRTPQGDIPGAPCRLSPAPWEGLFGRRRRKDKSSAQRQGHRLYFADRSVNPKANPTCLLQVPWESRGAEWLWAEHPDDGAAAPGPRAGWSRGGGEMPGHCLAGIPPERQLGGEDGDGDIPISLSHPPGSRPQPALRPVDRDGAAEDVNGGAQDGAVGQGHGVIPGLLHLSLQERERGGGGGCRPRPPAASPPADACRKPSSPSLCPSCPGCRGWAGLTPCSPAGAGKSR